MATTPPGLQTYNIQHTHTLLSEAQKHAQVVPAFKTRHQPLPAAAMGPEQLREPPQKGRRVEMRVEDCWAHVWVEVKICWQADGLWG